MCSQLQKKKKKNCLHCTHLFYYWQTSVFILFTQLNPSIFDIFILFISLRFAIFILFISAIFFLDIFFTFYIYLHQGYINTMSLYIWQHWHECWLDYLHKLHSLSCPVSFCCPNLNKGKKKKRKLFKQSLDTRGCLHFTVLMFALQNTIATCEVIKNRINLLSGLLLLLLLLLNLKWSEPNVPLPYVQLKHTVT